MSQKRELSDFYSPFQDCLSNKKNTFPFLWFFRLSITKFPINSVFSAILNSQ